MKDAPITMLTEQNLSHGRPHRSLPGAHLGFGLLRVDAFEPSHVAAVESARAAGIEVFDLGFFRADGALGKVALLQNVSASGKLRILVRGNLGEASQLTEFLAKVSTLPTAAANLSTSGFEWSYFIADPEFSLADFAHAHDALYGALEEEFSVLESLAELGAIESYGVGSAAFTYAKSDPQYLSLEALLSGARASAFREKKSFPHFGAVEFPLNLYESAAYQFENQNLGEANVSLLQSAKFYGLTTYARRPLDAITDTQLLRLVNYPDHHRLDLDAAVMETFRVALEREPAAGPWIERARVGAWAHRLREQLRHVNDPEHWKEVNRRKVAPDLAELRKLALEFDKEPESAGLKAYLEAMDALVLVIQLWCEKRGAERNERIRAKIVSAVPQLKTGGSATALSSKAGLTETAFLIYRSVPNLDYVLTGMRSPAYVEKALKVFQSDVPLLGEEDLVRAFDAAHSAIHSIGGSA